LVGKYRTAHCLLHHYLDSYRFTSWSVECLELLLVLLFGKFGWYKDT
jgi:hypothetical protein